jgi:hypothetical protein
MFMCNRNLSLLVLKNMGQSVTRRKICEVALKTSFHICIYYILICVEMAGFRTLEMHTDF